MALLPLQEDLNHQIKNKKMKIVSLVPSASEIICDLGLEENLVGVSHECNYPTSLRKLIL